MIVARQTLIASMSIFASASVHCQVDFCCAPMVYLNFVLFSVCD